MLNLLSLLIVNSFFLKTPLLIKTKGNSSYLNALRPVSARHSEWLACWEADTAPTPGVVMNDATWPWRRKYVLAQFLKRAVVSGPLITVLRVNFAMYL